MTEAATLIASGNLATPRRTITGVLSQLMLLQIETEKAQQMFTDAGLPPRALEEPDFPISLQQELILCLALVKSLRHSPVNVFLRADRNMGIENLGVLGMAMRHSATALDALKMCLTYPQLTWGHCRMLVYREAQHTRFIFVMEQPHIHDADPVDIKRLMEYCLVLDLLSSTHNISDIVGGTLAPVEICLPFPEPEDWQEAAALAPCSFRFAATEASLVYSQALDDVALPAANSLACRTFVSAAETLSQMLAEDISLSERVTRWLWAYTPPLSRGELATQLAMSERSLTRRLNAEGTSYAQLLVQVQHERARNFLRNPSLSVSEVAYRLGYSDPAAFTRAFSQWSGLSPLKWRKSTLSKTLQ